MSAPYARMKDYYAPKENLKCLVNGHRNGAQTVGAHVVSVMLPRAYGRRKTLYTYTEMRQDIHVVSLLRTRVMLAS